MATRSSKRATPPFDVRERSWIRRELALHRDRPSDLGDGVLLRSWKNGPGRGTPKIPPAVHSLMNRGLMEIRSVEGSSRAFFTAQGIDALRLLVSDERSIDPAEFREMRRYLGIGDAG